MPERRPGKPTRGERIAAEARAWLGTPFAEGQAAKGRGCDCKGLVAGVARECGFAEAGSLYGEMTGYSLKRPIDAALLREGLAALFDRVDDDGKPGDVLLLQDRGKPTHLAIDSGEIDGQRRAIHAQVGMMGHKAHVKETRLAALTHLYPIDSRWRWRPLARKAR